MIKYLLWKEHMFFTPATLPLPQQYIYIKKQRSLFPKPFNELVPLSNQKALIPRETVLHYKGPILYPPGSAQGVFSSFNISYLVNVSFDGDLTLHEHIISYQTGMSRGFILHCSPWALENSREKHVVMISPSQSNHC